MSLLIAGLVIWTLVHFLPSKGISFKRKLLDSLGANGYKGVFSLLILTALVLIVFGWRSSVPSHLYALPAFVKPIALILMVMAFLLFGAAKQSTRLKQYVRHPQLTSVIVWSIAHLLLNGDTRSLVLFGWLGIWALLEIFAINKREGEWTKPEIPTMAKEVQWLVVSLVIFAVLVIAHPYLAGVAVV